MIFVQQSFHPGRTLACRYTIITVSILWFHAAVLPWHSDVKCGELLGQHLQRTCAPTLPSWQKLLAVAWAVLSWRHLPPATPFGRPLGNWEQRRPGSKDAQNLIHDIYICIYIYTVYVYEWTCTTVMNVWNFMRYHPERAVSVVFRTLKLSVNFVFEESKASRWSMLPMSCAGSLRRLRSVSMLMGWSLNSRP